MNRILLAALTAAALSSAAIPAQAQDYPDGYRDGYRAGYADGRNGRDYDDRVRDRDRYDDRGGYGDRGGYNDGDRADAWRRRYSRHYTYQDDSYYRECRGQPDPAGIIAGAIIGGLIGNGISRGSAGATVAGVVVGGAAGAALTSEDRDCGDRSYIYRTYYDAFNAGREGRTYDWRNPQTGNWGGVRTDRFYNDEDGFRCVAFSQSFRIEGAKRERRGVACRDPNGSWAVVR